VTNGWVGSTYNVDMLDKEMIHVPGRMKLEGARFETMCNLKLLLETSIKYFSTAIDNSYLKPQEAKLQIRELLYRSIKHINVI
jgi:hypothetical protein